MASLKISESSQLVVVVLGSAIFCFGFGLNPIRRSQEPWREHGLGGFQVGPRHGGWETFINSFPFFALMVV